MTRIAIILVHYHTAHLLAGAVAALQAELSKCHLQADLIVVDNGSTEADRVALRGLPVRWIDPGSNLGYAGALNLGVRDTDADILFFMNCDVEVLPGCIGLLVQALSQGAAAVGPKFYWDRDKTVVLPPTEDRQLISEMWRRLSGTGEHWMAKARAHWRRHAYKHWTATQILRSSALSGALLGVRRDSWNRTGPFDDGFKLYYEETDWLLRLQQKGLKSYYVPAAEAVHLYNQSAVKESQAVIWCASSTKRFQKRYYGELLTSLLDRLPNNLPPARANAHLLAGARSEINIALATLVPSTCRWIELSPLMTGFPAAGAHVSDSGNWELSADLWDHMSPGTYCLQTLDDLGTELQHFRFEVKLGTREVVQGGIGYA
jgi:GT2 family glycosyltransferase